MKFKQISIKSGTHLTVTEKKILLQMLNNNLLEGQVKNKIFRIELTNENKANLIITTIEKSILLNKNQYINDKYTIEFK